MSIKHRDSPEAKALNEEKLEPVMRRANWVDTGTWGPTGVSAAISSPYLWVVTSSPPQATLT